MHQQPKSSEKNNNNQGDKQATNNTYIRIKNCFVTQNYFCRTLLHQTRFHGLCKQHGPAQIYSITCWMWVYAFLKWEKRFSCCFAFSFRCCAAYWMNVWINERSGPMTKKNTQRISYFLYLSISSMYFCIIYSIDCVLVWKHHLVELQSVEPNIKCVAKTYTRSRAPIVLVLIIILIQTTWAESALNFVYRQITSTKACN